MAICRATSHLMILFLQKNVCCADRVEPRTWMPRSSVRPILVVMRTRSTELRLVLYYVLSEPHIHTEYEMNSTNQNTAFRIGIHRHWIFRLHYNPMTVNTMTSR